jgi:hypothetical protein
MDSPDRFLAWTLVGLGVLGLVAGLGMRWFPSALRRGWTAFPRSRAPGWILAAVGVFWVAWVVQHAALGRFEVLKPFIPFAAVGRFGAIVYFLDELLAPRALGGLLLLVANPVLNGVRWADSAWRIVPVVASPMPGWCLVRPDAPSLGVPQTGRAVAGIGGRTSRAWGGASCWAGRCCWRPGCGTCAEGCAVAEAHRFPFAPLFGAARRGHRGFHRHAARPAGLACAMAPGADRNLGLSAHRQLAVAGGLAETVVSLDRAEMARFFVPVPQFTDAQVAAVRSFDLIFNYLHDPVGQVRSNLLLAGAKQVLSGSPLIKRGHAVPFLLEPLQALAIFETERLPELDLSGEARAAGPDAIACAGIEGAARGGASRAAAAKPKKWPVERFAEIIRRLRAKTGRETVAVLGESDVAEAAVSGARAGGPAGAGQPDAGGIGGGAVRMRRVSGQRFGHHASGGGGGLAGRRRCLGRRTPDVLGAARSGRGARAVRARGRTGAAGCRHGVGRAQRLASQPNDPRGKPGGLVCAAGPGAVTTGLRRQGSPGF